MLTMTRLYHLLTLAALLIWAVLVLPTHACPPPFNDIRYLNTTLLTEFVNEQKMQSVEEKRGLHKIGPSSPIRTWPTLDHDGITRIRYCYYTQEVENQMSLIFEAAWALWRGVIGEPGPRNGHRLGGFVQVKDEFGHSLPCFVRLPNRWEWNPSVPPDVLAIDTNLMQVPPQFAHLNPVPGGMATMGYKPESLDKSSGRNLMVMKWHPRAVIDTARVTFAHELGHVLGLMHEHQREDRDHWIRFQCKNLNGYTQIMRYIKRHKLPANTIEDLCTSSTLSRIQPWSDFSFAAADYSTEPTYLRAYADAQGNRIPIPSYPSGPYDKQSIMHYSSELSRNQERPLRATTAVLVAWTRGAPDYRPPKRVTEANARTMLPSPVRYPSHGDKMSIIHLYPWGQ